jgi:hypothetical protein
MVFAPIALSINTNMAAEPINAAEEWGQAKVIKYWRK